MKPKILITGPPRCGKSTLISKLIEHYSKKNYVIFGFKTPEVRNNDGNRVGFDLEDIFSGKKTQLARIGNYKTQFKLGKYRIFIDKFEKLILKLELIQNKKVDLIVLDEIGKMELFSRKFQEFVKKIFRSNISIIATIGKKMQHPLKDYILNVPEVILFNLTRQNQQKVFQEIISMIH